MENKTHPKLRESKDKIERKIQIAIREAVSEFEEEVGLWVTGIKLNYCKNDYMYNNSVEVEYSPELPKGVR